MFTTWQQSHSYPLKSTCCGLRSLPFTTKHIRYSFGKPTLRHLSKQYISTLPVHITTSIDLHDVAHWKLRGCCVFCGSLDDQTQITCSNIHLLTASRQLWSVSQVKRTMRSKVETWCSRRHAAHVLSSHTTQKPMVNIYQSAPLHFWCTK